MEIFDILNKIEYFDNDVYKKAKTYQDTLIKPPKSLGVLEDIACKICAIKSDLHPILNKKRLIVFSSDNGVFEEKVSSCPQNITIDQTINLTYGITGASSMAKCFNDDIEVYDLGVNNDIDKYIDDINKKYNINIINKVIDKKITYSTKNILKESSMQYKDMLNAIFVGFNAIKKAKDDGMDIVGIGEMGICNTTTTTALLSILSGVTVKNITGRGAGLTDDDYLNKIIVIEKTIKRVFDDKDLKYISSNIKECLLSNKELSSEFIDKYIFKSLYEVSGYDICAMIGAYIGSAYYKIPAVVDGYIGIVSSLVAVLLNNKIKDYIFASHISKEPGYHTALELLKLKPMFDLEMRLGEGSGCIVAFRIIDCALAMHNNMKTFNEANIDDSYLNDIR